MEESQAATKIDQGCKCVVLNKPVDATTSMWDCPEHGEVDDLKPVPGQSLKYAMLIGLNDSHQLIGPLTTSDKVDNAKFMIGRLGYTFEGLFLMSSFSDLEKLAAERGALSPPETLPTETNKLPKGLVPVQEHLRGCLYAEQGHPGLCYVAPAGEGRFA